jgi:hypothetical protein
MTVAVPNVVRDLCFLEARMEPRVGDKILLIVGEHDISPSLALALHGFDCFDRISVEMNRPSRSVLGLRQFDRATIEGDLPPLNRVLL